MFVRTVIALGFVTLLAAGAASADSHRLTLWQAGDEGERMVVRGRVTNPEREPLAGAEVHVRHADAHGVYHPHRFVGVMVTDERGRYEVRTVRPAGYGFGGHIHMDVVHEAFGSTTERIEFVGDPAHGGSSPPGAVLLEETRLDGEVVKIGTFDVVLGQ